MLRPDRNRFWRRWRARLPRLVVVIAAGAMVTLLLLAVDWTPLGSVHLGWLVTVAVVLLAILWIGVVFVAAALAFVAVALRVDRVELDSGRVRRHLVFGRRMEVPVEGAAVNRRRSYDVVTVPGARGRVLAPHLFYAPEDLDRLWAAAGINGSEAQPTP